MNKKHADQILDGIKSGDELEAALIAGDKQRAAILKQINKAKWEIASLYKNLADARSKWKSHKSHKQPIQPIEQ